MGGCAVLQNGPRALGIPGIDPDRRLRLLDDAGGIVFNGDGQALAFKDAGDGFGVFDTGSDQETHRFLQGSRVGIGIARIKWMPTFRTFQ